MISNIVGWTALIASWALPQKWFKSADKHRAVAMAIATFATGIFFGTLLEKYCN